MAESSNANGVPKGTTLIFGSWACTTDGSRGFSGQLIMPKALEVRQSAEADDATKLCENQAPPELNSENLGNMSTPTRTDESSESDTNSNFENFQFSQTLGEYVAYLKSIKHPRVVNSELLDGVDRVSRSIEGCIKHAESALGSSKT